ncbi:hypothetical protein C8R43DRAFT_964683 [Mycena crocata]|nr:hypothetical protein C8R43DRAFT_964683 [Mycena crocata]
MPFAQQGYVIGTCPPELENEGYLTCATPFFPAANFVGPDEHDNHRSRVWHVVETEAGMLKVYTDVAGARYGGCALPGAIYSTFNTSQELSHALYDGCLRLHKHPAGDHHQIPKAPQNHPYVAWVKADPDPPANRRTIRAARPAPVASASKAITPAPTDVGESKPATPTPNKRKRSVVSKPEILADAELARTKRPRTNLKMVRSLEEAQRVGKKWFRGRIIVRHHLATIPQFVSRANTKIQCNAIATRKSLEAGTVKPPGMASDGSNSRAKNDAAVRKRQDAAFAYWAQHGEWGTSVRDGESELEAIDRDQAEWAAYCATVLARDCSGVRPWDTPCTISYSKTTANT